MKYLFFTIFLTVFELTACSNKGDKLEKPDNPSDSTVVKDKKDVLTGSFIDFWGKEKWSTSDWKSFFQEMKDIGLTTGIIQFMAYENKGGSSSTTWFNSDNSFTKIKVPDALSKLLSAAVDKNIDIHIGLYFSEEYWNSQTDVTWLKLHAERCIEIANEIQVQFGANTAFKGWYIPHEPEPYAYNSSAKVLSFRENFVDKISNHLHELNN